MIICRIGRTQENISQDQGGFKVSITVCRHCTSSHAAAVNQDASMGAGCKRNPRRPAAFERLPAASKHEQFQNLLPSGTPAAATASSDMEPACPSDVVLYSLVDKHSGQLAGLVCNHVHELIVNHLGGHTHSAWRPDNEHGKVEFLHGILVSSVASSCREACMRSVGMMYTQHSSGSNRLTIQFCSSVGIMNGTRAIEK